MILGSMLQKSYFVFPWLVSHMISIVILCIIFVGWTFIAFFISLLLAVAFPILAGMFLGLIISMWVLVHDHWKLIRAGKTCIPEEDCLPLKDQLVA